MVSIGCRSHVEIPIDQILMRYLEEHPIGELYDAPFDVYLSNVDVFQPDILFVSNDNRRILTDAGAEGPPDLVAEVLSAKTRNLDLIQKCRVYAREGVRELWILDPEPQTVVVYRFDEDLSNPVMTRTVTATLTSAIFPGLEIVLEKLFRK
jgi:Uma2 family endonuclease